MKKISYKIWTVRVCVRVCVRDGEAVVLNKVDGGAKEKNKWDEVTLILITQQVST